MFIKEGFDAVIGYPPFIRDELKYKNYRNSIFLEKGVNPTPEYYQLLADKGILCFDHSDEGAASKVYSVDYAPAVAAMKHMQILFLWGAAQKNEIMAINPDLDLSKRYKISGYAGFDVTTPSYKRYHRSLSKGMSNESYVLINTNFGCFNGHGADEELKACSAISPESIASIKKSYKVEEEDFPYFIKKIRILLESFPDQKFLLRPHPTEKQETYKRIFKGYRNLTISKTGTVNQALSRALVVIHKNCTTALQSYLMGIPVISLSVPSTKKMSSHSWSYSFGVAICSEEDLIKKMTVLLKTKVWEIDVQKRIDKRANLVIDKHFAQLGSAGQSIVTDIIRVYKSKTSIFQPYILNDSRTVWQKTKCFIRKFLPLTYKTSQTEAEIIETVTRLDVKQRLVGLEEVNPLRCKYKIKKLYPNSFLIRAE